MNSSGLSSSRSMFSIFISMELVLILLSFFSFSYLSSFCLCLKWVIWSVVCINSNGVFWKVCKVEKICFYVKIYRNFCTNLCECSNHDILLVICVMNSRLTCREKMGITSEIHTCAKIILERKHIKIHDN